MRDLPHWCAGPLQGRRSTSSLESDELHTEPDDSEGDTKPEEQLAMPFHSAEQHHIRAKDGEKDASCGLRLSFAHLIDRRNRAEQKDQGHERRPHSDTIPANDLFCNGPVHAVAHSRVSRLHIYAREWLYGSGATAATTPDRQQIYDRSPRHLVRAVGVFCLAGQQGGCLSDRHVSALRAVLGPWKGAQR